MQNIEYPKSLPLSSKLVWQYKDCFNDYPATKLCMSWLHKEYSIDMHIHEFYEINIILSGEGIHYANDKRTFVKRGDIFIVPPNTMHGYYNISHLYVWHAMIQDQFFKKYSADLDLVSAYHILFGTKNNYIIHIPCYDDNELEPVINTMQNIYESLLENGSFKMQSAEFIKSYIHGLNLIVQLCELYTNLAETSNQIPQSGNESIYRAIDYIHDNYQSKIDIDILCKVSAMSRTPFFKKFQEVTKTTPNEFITSYRLRIANKLLLETDFSIEHIAELSGFYDSPHFIKSFEKEYGKTPLKVRKS